MMENVRIAILSTYDRVLAFMDNMAPGALHYYEDELKSYLQGAAATFRFSAGAGHEDARYLQAGNKLAFVHNKKEYYFNILRTDETETEVSVTAFSLSFELLNETLGEYKSLTRAMTIEEYIAIFDTEKCVEIGINELSAVKSTGEFSEETLLARFYSLAEIFSAEIEFVPVLNDDHSLKKVVMNIYREHSGKNQGIGKDRTDIVLRYGQEVKGIRKSVDISGLFTAIRPYGKDGLNLLNITGTELDENGNVEYECKKGALEIRAVQARNRFPSNLISKDRYITVNREYDETYGSSLYHRALHDLKDGCVPKATYEIEGYFNTDIGDTVSVEDAAFNPPLYLSARVTEQTVSFTDPTRNRSTFSNVKEEQAQLSQAMLKKMQAMIRASRIYSCSIVTDNGIIFKNGTGETTLTALVMDDGEDITEELTIRWYKDGAFLAEGVSLTVRAEDVPDRAVYRFEAVLGNVVKGSYEATVMNISTPVSYKMTLDAAAIKWDPQSRTYTPEQISASAFIRKNGEFVPYMAFFTFECLERGWYTDLEINRESTAYTPPAGRVISAVRVSMYEYGSYAAGEGILLDQIIVPVVSDAEAQKRAPGVFHCTAASSGSATASLTYDTVEIPEGFTLAAGDLIITANGQMYTVDSLASSIQVTFKSSF